MTAPTPPTQGFFRRNPELSLLLGLAALLLGGLVLHDRLAAAGRELVIVNQSGQAAQVTCGQREPLQVSHGALEVVALGEGTHRVQVALGGGPSREIEVKIAGSFASRLLGGEVVVLNLDAAAPIVWEELIYGPSEEASSQTPARVEMGELLVFRRVDEVFKPFPKNSSDGPRVRIGLAPGEPAHLLGALASAQRSAEGPLRYAEHHLDRSPDDEKLLSLYVQAALIDHAATGASFLSRRLAERPVRVPWHRAYQDLQRAAGRLEDLRAEYAAAIEAEAPNAALIALAARLASTPDEALAGYRAALAVDPQAPFAHFGVAVHLYRRASYPEARSHVEAALRVRPRDANFGNLRFLVRCAQDEWRALASELALATKAAPTSLSILQRYLESLVASGQSQEARAACQLFRQRLSDREDRPQLALLASLRLHGLEGRWEEFRGDLVRLKDADQRSRLAFMAALAEGKLADAGEPEGPAAVLQLALAWRLDPAGGASADTWRDRLSQDLAAGKGSWPALGQALASGDLDALTKLAISPDDKACAFALLAAEAPPESREALLAAATRYDLGRRYPHALLERARQRLGGD